MQQTLTIRYGAWITALLIAIGLLAAPQAAHAHDVLIESDPEIGSSLETAPTEIRLRFSGNPLSGEGLANLIRLTDADGNQWQDDEVAVEGYELTVPVCQGLPQGEYTVAYRVIYSDGHTGEERFTFTNADPNAPTQATPENCGEVSPDTTAQQPETTAPNDLPDTSNAQPPAEDDNTSASIPAWIWIAAIAGLLLIASIVMLVLRGSRAAETDGHLGDDA